MATKAQMAAHMQRRMKETGTTVWGGNGPVVTPEIVAQTAPEAPTPPPDPLPAGERGQEGAQKRGKSAKTGPKTPEK